jgi:hypothetical protein
MSKFFFFDKSIQIPITEQGNEDVSDAEEVSSDQESLKSEKYQRVK